MSRENNIASRVEVVNAPAVLPVTLAELKEHLAITVPDFDALLTAQLAAAIDYARLYLGRELITSEWRAWYDVGSLRMPIWEGVRQGAHGSLQPLMYWLPRPPLQEVLEVKTWTRLGVDAVVVGANWWADAVSDNMPGRLFFQDLSFWPSDPRPALTLSIELKAGYGDNPADVPEGIREAILQMAAFLWANRGDCMSKANAFEQSGAAATCGVYRMMQI